MTQPQLAVCRRTRVQTDFSGVHVHFYGWRLHSNKHSVCGPRFGRGACEIEPVARGVCLS